MFNIYEGYKWVESKSVIADDTEQVIRLERE